MEGVDCTICMAADWQRAALTRQCDWDPSLVTEAVMLVSFKQDVQTWQGRFFFCLALC